MSVVIVTTILTIPSHDHYYLSSSQFGLYFPFNIRSALASTAVIESISSVMTTTTTADAENRSLANVQNSTIRNYTNPLFGISVEYPSDWSAFEMNSLFPSNDSYAAALLRAPLENSSDKFAERILFGVQYSNFNNVTLDTYTSDSLAAYQNASGIQILEATPTTLSNQPAHGIVYTDDSIEGIKLKKIQAWTVLNNSRVYVITFGAEESKYSNYLPEVQNIFGSFSIDGNYTNNTVNQQEQLQLRDRQPRIQQQSLQQETNLTFDDSAFGIRLQYPSSWMKYQPGQPSAGDNVDVVVAFLLPEVQQNVSSSLSRIGIGVQHPISQNISLDQYTSNQLETINRQNATMLESGKATLAGNPAHRAVFTLQNLTKVVQIWTLKEDKAYITTYQASLNDYPKNLPNFQRIVESLQIA
jgi:PsbP-like protein